MGKIKGELGRLFVRQYLNEFMDKYLNVSITEVESFYEYGADNDLMPDFYFTIVGERIMDFYICFYENIMM